MTTADYLINLVLSVILIVGAYQFYFFTQQHRVRKPLVLRSTIDDRISFIPAWSWVYSFLYYPAILVLNLIVESPRHFTHMAVSFIGLLVLQMLCFAVFPVATPPHWRERIRARDAATRFLKLVRYYDGPTNCFPSMHVSVATLAACFAWATLGWPVILFPVLIGVSCVMTKQHYLIDLPFGALLGLFVFLLYRHFH